MARLPYRKPFHRIENEVVRKYQGLFQLVPLMVFVTLVLQQRYGSKQMQHIVKLVANNFVVLRFDPR